jgi:hypothetical protein
MAACKHQQPPAPVPDNPDDFSVDFSIYESFYGGFKVATDTIVMFSALMHFDEVYNEYKWQVGSQEYFTRDLSLTFGEEDTNAPIPVTLYAKKTYYVNGEQVIKSGYMTRMLVLKTLEKSNLSKVVEAWKVVRSPYIGNFKGVFTDNAKDTFTVFIADHGMNPNPSNGSEFWDTRIYNLPNGCGGPDQKDVCPTVTNTEIQRRYYAPAFQAGYLGFSGQDGVNEPGACCPEISFNGLVINQARDSVQIDCKISYGGGPVQKKVFLGKKIK